MVRETMGRLGRALPGFTEGRACEEWPEVPTRAAAPVDNGQPWKGERGVMAGPRCCGCGIVLTALGGGGGSRVAEEAALDDAPQIGQEGLEVSMRKCIHGQHVH